MTGIATKKPSVLIGMSGGLYGLDEAHDTVPRVLLPGVQPTALAIDPAEPQRIYCSTFNRGLWRSEDGGATWHPVGTPQSYYEPQTKGAIGPRETTFVSVDPRPDAQGRHAVWVGTELSSLYRSDDHGETFHLATTFDTQKSRGTWSFPPRPKTHHVRWIAHGEAGRIYVSIEFGALLRSLDGGSTFEDRLPNSPLDTHVLRTHPAAPGRLYAALGDGLMQRGRSYAESLDGGATWIYLSEGFGEMVYLYGMAISPTDPNDIRVAASIGPRAAHGDQGSGWKSAARAALSRLHLARDTDGPSTIFRREGDNWVEHSTGFPHERSLIPVIATDPGRPGRWLALSNLGLFEAQDNGAWQVIAARPEWVDMHPMCLAVV